jgi:hypothetical protein
VCWNFTTTKGTVLTGWPVLLPWPPCRYLGKVMNRAARIMGAAPSGSVYCSALAWIHAMRVGGQSAGLIVGVESGYNSLAWIHAMRVAGWPVLWPDLIWGEGG